MRLRIALLAGAVIAAVDVAGVDAQTTCASLAQAVLTDARIAAAQTVDAGAFQPPGGRGGGRGGAAFAALRPFCRVAATLTPAPQSAIGVEVWLPSDWNGRLQVVGNGAFAGTISYPAMASALAAGYAAASTDTGHTGPAANTFANQDVLIDFAHRAVHETTAFAKLIVARFYGKPQQFAYFNGCSTGGRQALTAAQRYPADFDGIVAGAPATFTSAQVFSQVLFHQALSAPGAALPREALELLHARVLAACDGNDGAADGVLENPLACRFDPEALACRDGSGGPDACLTPPQVEAAKKVYAGAVHARTGDSIFPGLEKGSELGWSATPVSYAVDWLKYVFKDPAWDPKSLDFDADVATVTAREFRLLDANDPNLTPFVARGGKLLMYQGWAEPGIPPRNIVRYFDEVQKVTPDASEAVRLFMVPGMGHCGGGNGTSTFDMIAALDAWKTKDAAPETIPASRVRNGVADRTRPLCAYPTFARYRGAGSVDDAASFVCADK